jgi:multimeric flavodoxin WrbA
LREALAGAQSAGAEVKEIVLNDLDFCACQECGGCDETGECTYDDDMQAVYQKLEEADRIVLASPIFFGSLPAQVKMMIDRCQCLWVTKYLLKKPMPDKSKRKGIFICVGGMNRQDFFEASKKLVKIFFANLNISYAGDLFYPGIDEKGAILNHPTAIKEAFEIGRRLALDSL